MRASHALSEIRIVPPIVGTEWVSLEATRQKAVFGLDLVDRLGRE